MTESAVVYTNQTDSREAGEYLGNQIATKLKGERPDALILFASAQHNYADLLKALEAACQPQILVGCSSAGEFTNQAQGEQSACAVALKSSNMKFAAALGRGLRQDVAAAAEQLTASFQGLTAGNQALFRSALVLNDALAGRADDLIDHLTRCTGGTYQFFGGGAGDDAHFSHTEVFYGTEAVPDAAVALEILSEHPLGIGVKHGWAPASPGLRVTEAEGIRLISLNSMPAVEVFQEHAEATKQNFNPAEPTSFFLHNVLGIDTGNGHKLRVPLAVNDDGSITCAADVPEGATVYLMQATTNSAAEAADAAMQAALHQMAGHPPKVALFFDCVATRLRTGRDFGFELAKVQQALGVAEFAGFNTYGQIARAPGQFSGFHNCTAVVCVIPE